MIDQPLMRSIGPRAHRGNHPRPFVVARQSFDVGVDLGLLRSPGGIGSIFGAQAADRLRMVADLPLKKQVPLDLIRFGADAKFLPLAKAS